METNNINDIEIKKQELRKAINAKEEEIDRLWNELFTPPVSNAFETPTQRFMRYAHNSVGVIDGAILGWKLYRKLGKTFSFKRHKK